MNLLNNQGLAADSVNRLVLSAVLAILVLAGCESPEERAAGYVARAEQLLEEENLVKAELEVRNALQIEPNNADARFLLARVAESRGDFGEMAANLRAAVKSRPDFLEARLKLGTLYALSGAPDRANEQLVEVEKLAPNDPEVRVLKARLLAADGDLDAAAEELRVAITEKPDSMEAMGLLANVTAESDVDAALDIVDQAIASTEENRVLRILKVQLLERGGYLDRVESELRSIVADYPDEPVYSYQLARFLAGEGKVDDVEAVLGAVVARNPEDTEAKLALIQFTAGIRGPDEGQALLRRFIDESPDDHELRMVLARQLQVTGETEQAMAEYQKVVDAAGNEDVALTATSRLAAIELGQDNTEAGEALIEEVIAVDSQNSEALLLRGALRYDRDELKDAVSDLRTVLRNQPENERAQLLLSRSHSKAGDFLLARDAYRRSIEMNPANVQATMELTRILVNESEFAKAEALLRDQTLVTPEDLNAPRALIAILVTNRRYDDALEEAQRVRELPERAAVGDFLSGGIYQARGQYEAAVNAFRASLDATPATREPLQGLISSLVRLERRDEAVSYLENLVAESPENLYAKTLLGQVLAGSGESDAAREIFEEALSGDSAWLPAYTALAGLEGGNSEAQIDVYRRGLEAVPNSQELALLLGTALERKGQFDEAIAAYEEVLRANPEMEVVANNLAALLADHRTDRGSFERARDLSEQFENSQNPAYLDTLGWVYYRLGEFDNAQPLLEKAVGAADTVPVLRYHLGMNYLAQNKPSLAREQLAAALETPEIEFLGKAEAEAALAEIDSASNP